MPELILTGALILVVFIMIAKTAIVVPQQRAPMSSSVLAASAAPWTPAFTS